MGSKFKLSEWALSGLKFKLSLAVSGLWQQLASFNFKIS
jgi:hypothetical protein